MKKDLTEIAIVLDRSGSMANVVNDTIGGYGNFIEGQRKTPGECVVSLFQFDNEYETVYQATPVKEVKLPLLFLPRGGTALLDAMGRTIASVGARLSALDESQRPEKVIVVIMTDGGENASKEYSRDRVFEMIKLQKESYGWDFVFIGANQDAISVGASFGIAAGKSMTYASNAMGTSAAFASLNSYTATIRGAASPVAVASAVFSAEDRKKQKEAGAT